MEKETIIPQISDAAKEKIKRIVKYHYGFEPKDKDIKWIDETIRNHYSVLHEQRIIRNLITVEIDNILLKHRTKIGSEKFEKICLDKLIFYYLMLASMSYRAGIPIATILLCRTALEAGLRERIAEKLAENECRNKNDLPEKVLEKIKALKDNTLGTKKGKKGLINLAEENGVISENEIEKIFSKLKFGQQKSRKILDKFIHGDLTWIVSFIKEKDKDSRVMGAKNILDEYKIIAESSIDDIAFKVLRGTTKVAEILYFRDM